VVAETRSASTVELVQRDFAGEQPLYMQYEMMRSRRHDPDFSETAIHALDAALFLLGSPFRRAALSCRELPELGKGIANFIIDAECVSGAQIRFDIRPVCGVVRESVTIQTLNRTLFLDLPVGSKSIQSGSLACWHNNQETLHIDLMGTEEFEVQGFYTETAAFIEAIQQRKATAPQLEELRQQVRLMEAIRDREPEVVW
jgi:myo-inositol 2-dehydrogenase / D-chiro-inositol 1-dehydrogenase